MPPKLRRFSDTEFGQSILKDRAAAEAEIKRARRTKSIQRQERAEDRARAASAKMLGKFAKPVARPRLSETDRFLITRDDRGRLERPRKVRLD